MNKRAAINQAVDYLASRGVSVPPKVAALAKSREIKQAGYYQGARAELWAAMYDAVYNVLSAPIARTGPRATIKARITDIYQAVAIIAYEDGGGTLPIDEETNDYVMTELAGQLLFVENLFSRLIDLRKEGDVDAIHEAFGAADRWTSALDGFYNSVRMMAMGNKMVTWYLGATEQHCPTCSRLDGQRHRASWFSRRGYYPRKPGSNTDCGGYRCDCALVDDRGNEMTI